MLDHLARPEDCGRKCRVGLCQSSVSGRKSKLHGREQWINWMCVVEQVQKLQEVKANTFNETKGQKSKTITSKEKIGIAQKNSDKS